MLLIACPIMAHLGDIKKSAMALKPQDYEMKPECTPVIIDFLQAYPILLPLAQLLP